MIGGSLQEMIGKLASVPLPQLHAMTKDPAIGYLAATELRARNQKRAAMQPPMQPPQGTVVDAEAQKAAQAEMAGIMGGIPMQPQQPVQRMANGGVVGFAEGGSPSEMEILAKARELQLRDGIPYEKALVRAQFMLGSFKAPAQEDTVGARLFKYLASNGQTPTRSSGTTVSDVTSRAEDIERTAGVPYEKALVRAQYELNGFNASAPPPVSDVYPDIRGSMTMPQRGVVAPPPNIKPPGAPPQAGPGPSGSSSASAGIMSGTAGGGGTGGWSKMPELVQPKEYLTPDMMKAAMEGQRAALEQREQNAYRAPDLEKQQSDLLAQRNWLDQQNPQDPDVVAAKARLDKQIRQLENNRPNNIRQGWIEAGLGMLASESPYFGVGVGRGGLQGTRAFRELEANDARRLDSLGNQQMQAGLAEQARKAGIFNSAIAMQAQREGQLERERAGKDAILQDKGKLAMLPVSMAETAAGIDTKAGENAYRANASRLGLGELEVRRRNADNDIIQARLRAATSGGGSDRGDEDWRYIDILRKMQDSEVKNVMKRTGTAAEFEALTSQQMKTKSQQERALKLYNDAHAQAVKNVGVFANSNPRMAAMYKLMMAADTGVPTDPGERDNFGSGTAPQRGMMPR